METILYVIGAILLCVLVSILLKNKGKAVSYLGQFARYWTAKVAYNAYQKFAFV